MAARTHRIVADATALASRLERLSAAAVVRLVEAAKTTCATAEPHWVRCGAGVVAYLSPGSPLNHAVGIGVDEPVGEAAVVSMESFFGQRGERPCAAVAEPGNDSLFGLLSARGWTAGGSEYVLVSALSPKDDFEVPAGIEIVEARTAESRDMWASVAATGFSAPLEPLRVQLEVASAAAATQESRLFFAYIDGAVAGTGEMTIADGVAWLSADATLPPCRRRGVQSALQSARLDIAVKSGCEMAVSEAAPGSGSQRNMERLGFTVAYSRVDMMGPQKCV